jgi:hypothetical protein
MTVVENRFVDQSVCLYVNPPIVARQRLAKNVTAATNTHATIGNLLDASFLVPEIEVWLFFRTKRTIATQQTAFFIVTAVIA